MYFATSLIFYLHPGEVALFSQVSLSVQANTSLLPCFRFMVLIFTSLTNIRQTHLKQIKVFHSGIKYFLYPWKTVGFPRRALTETQFFLFPSCHDSGDPSWVVDHRLRRLQEQPLRGDHLHQPRQRRNHPRPDRDQNKRRFLHPRHPQETSSSVIRGKAD